MEKSKECKQLANRIHKIIDPIWQSGAISRGEIYRRLSKAAGVPNFHAHDLVDPEQGRKALAEAIKIYSEALVGRKKHGRRK